VNEDELRQAMYGWELKAVPDPMAYPPFERTFGSAAPWRSSPNRYPIHSVQDVSHAVDVATQRIRSGMITINEARAQFGLGGF
jgi:hypothetical protein